MNYLSESESETDSCNVRYQSLPRCCILFGAFSICVYCERFISESLPGSDYTRLEPCTYWAEQDVNKNNNNKHSLSFYLILYAVGVAVLYWKSKVMWLNVLNKPFSRQISIPLLRVARRTMCEMARVFVRSVENEERMQITFRYPPDSEQPLAKQRVYNFDRLKTEGLERTANHIATKINNVVMKRLKRKNKSLGVDVIPTEVRVLLSEDGSVICSSEPNASAWTNGRCMQIEDQLFHVCVNVPSIRKLSLPQPMMVGFPVYANVGLEFADISDCEFTWYRMSNGSALTSPEKSDNLLADDTEEHESVATKKYKKGKQNEETPVKIFIGRSYIPTVEDIGCQLKLECIPVKGEVTGEMVSAVSSTTVQNGPTISCPFEKRHKFTEQLTSGDWFVLLFGNFVPNYITKIDHIYRRLPAPRQ